MVYSKLQKIIDNPRNNAFIINHDEELGGIYLTDFKGYVLEVEEMKELISGLQKIIERVSPEEIKNINSELDKEKETAMLANLRNNHGIIVRKPARGVVYFIRDDKGRIKIGKAKNIKERMGEYTKLPFEPEIIHLIESDDYHATEIQFHELFAEKRLRGEWFDLTDKDIEMIKTI